MKFLGRSLLILLALYGLVFAIGDLYLAHAQAPFWSAIVFVVVVIGIQYLIAPWLIHACSRHRLHGGVAGEKSGVRRTRMRRTWAQGAANRYNS